MNAVQHFQELYGLEKFDNDTLEHSYIHATSSWLNLDLPLDQQNEPTPIESLMAMALCLVAEADPRGCWSNRVHSSPQHVTNWMDKVGCNLCVAPQVNLVAYIPDFVIFGRRRKRYFGVVVECDGHEFHEKTKEQASRDKLRDRRLLRAGWHTIRYSGSDIWRDPVGCAEDAIECTKSVIRQR